MTTISQSCYYLDTDQPDNSRFRITVEPRERDYQNVVVLVDASASMGEDLDTVKTVTEAALAAGAIVVIFSTTAVVLLPSCKKVYWDQLVRSYSWNDCTSYEEAFKAVEDRIYDDSIILFVTDGVSNSGHHVDILQRIHQKIQSKGFMQAVCLGTGGNMGVLATLCTDGRTPVMTNRGEFETVVRGFLYHSIHIQETKMGVRVGAFRVELVDGGEGLELTDIKDVPLMCGAVAAVLTYIQFNPATSNILATVRRLNYWMYGDRHAGVQRVVQAGQALVDSSNTDTFSNLPNVAKVLVYQQDIFKSKLVSMVDAAMDCMANNPITWARQSFIVRHQIRARF